MVFYAIEFYLEKIQANIPLGKALILKVKKLINLKISISSHQIERELALNAQIATQFALLYGDATTKENLFAMLVRNLSLNEKCSISF